MARSIDEAFESVTTSIASAYTKENLVRLRAPATDVGARDDQRRTSMSDKLAIKLAKARSSGVEKVLSNAKAIEFVVVMTALAALWVQCARRYIRYSIAYEKSARPDYDAANADSDTFYFHWALLLCLFGVINCRYVVRFLCARHDEHEDPIALCIFVFTILVLVGATGSIIFASVADLKAEHDYPATLCRGATPLHVLLYRGGPGAALRADVFEPEGYRRSFRPGHAFSMDAGASKTAFVLSLAGRDENVMVAYDLSAGTATLPTLDLNATFPAVSNTRNLRMGPIRFQGLNTTLMMHAPLGQNPPRMSVNAFSGLWTSQTVLWVGPCWPSDRSVLSACIASDEGQAAAMVLVSLGLTLHYFDIGMLC